MNFLVPFGFNFGTSSKLNIPVWNALYLHIEYLKNNNQNQVFILIENISLFEELKSIKKYNDNNFILFKSNKELFFLVKKLDINYLYSPDIISTTKLLYLKFITKIKVVNWFQGVLPEESFLKNNNFFKKKVLEFFESLVLKLSDKNVFVSEGMVDHYSNKYRYKKNNYIILPCISDFSKNNFYRKKNSFVYIGGITEWQCFEDIIKLFNKIKYKLEDAKLDVITLDITKANNIIKSIDQSESINVFSINDRNIIPEKLSNYEYGFLIRKDDIINKVSSPIKFAEYLSCGVNLIITDSVPHYAKIISDEEIGTVFKYDQLDFIDVNLKLYKNSYDVYNKYFDKNRIKSEFLNFFYE